MTRGPRPPEAHPRAAARTAKRTRSGQLFRELGQQLSEATSLLADEPSSEAVTAALTSLAQAREALALLVLERAAGSSAPPTRPPDTPAVVRRVLLDVDRSAVRLGRAFTRSTCEQWSLPSPVVSAASDVVSELVTNAVTGANEPLVLALELGTDDLLVQVWDDGPGLPRLLPYRPGISERGIGLRLVSQLSTAWGALEEQGGKWVWARLGRGSGPAAPPMPRRPR